MRGIKGVVGIILCDVVVDDVDAKSFEEETGTGDDMGLQASG